MFRNMFFFVIQHLKDLETENINVSEVEVGDWGPPRLMTSFLPFYHFATSIIFTSSLNKARSHDTSKNKKSNSH
jgi:hypothetical protein